MRQPAATGRRIAWNRRRRAFIIPACTTSFTCPRSRRVRRGCRRHRRRDESGGQYCSSGLGCCALRQAWRLDSPLAAAKKSPVHGLLCSGISIPGPKRKRRTRRSRVARCRCQHQPCITLSRKPHMPLCRLSQSRPSGCFPRHRSAICLRLRLPCRSVNRRCPPTRPGRTAGRPTR